MKGKYNLALIPQTKADEVVSFARKFSTIADKYLLGENSNPHVTLYQFEVEEEDEEAIWARVSETWKEKPLTLTFNKMSCNTFDNVIYWVSLLPDQIAILHKMHGNVAGMIELPVKKSFDPHMTLINSKNKDYENEVQRLCSSCYTMTDTFVLCFGRSDDVGQLTEILYRHEPAKTCNNV